MSRLRLLIGGILTSFSALIIVSTPVLAATTTTTVVTPGTIANSAGDVISNPQKWLFYNDESDAVDSTLGSFVNGPSTPPAGVGSAQISVSGTQRRNLATYQFSGTPLSSITTLKYSTYNPSAGNPGSTQRSGYLQFNVDFNGSDTWQRRLTYVPSGNGTVTQNSWKEWDAINGGNALWTYSGATWPVTGEPGTTAKTWSQILSDYSGIRIRVSDAQLSIRVGEPYADGYTENIDKFVFGTASSTKIFDFEPTLTPQSKNDCKHDGWKTFNTPSFTSKKQCVAYVKEHHPKVEGALKMSGPSQKIVFGQSHRDDDEDNDHRGHNDNNRHEDSTKPQTVEYWNYDYPGGLHYKANVLCVGGSAANNEARVMFQIPVGHPGLSGLYVVAYVKEVHHGTDLYGHAATGDLATATQWCQTGVGFSITMYTVTKGEVEVN